MAFNRLLRFHVVRSTRPCVFIPACFLGQTAYRNFRDPAHIEKHRSYPDPQYYLNFTQKYFFRNESLRHLRVEQFNRYLYMAGEGVNAAVLPMTAEDTIEDNLEDAEGVDPHHRNYDEFMESKEPGAHFLSTAPHIPGCRRRHQQRLGVSRLPTIEPMGASREMFYESKLLLALPWVCLEVPETVQDAEGHNVTQWTFQCDPPSDAIEPIVFKIGGEHTPSFEVLCKAFEARFCTVELDLVCKCCTGELEDSPCSSCRHATSFHRCRNANSGDDRIHRWRKGTLFAGTLDIQRVLFNLHRKMLPTAALETKASEFVAAQLIDQSTADRVIRCIKLERGTSAFLNDGVDEVEQNAAAQSNVKLSPVALKDLLNSRIEMMKAGAAGDGITDQYRVYSHIIRCIESGTYLRLMVQASAGTGKVFRVLFLTFPYGFRLSPPLKLAAAMNIQRPVFSVELRFLVLFGAWETMQSGGANRYRCFEH